MRSAPRELRVPPLSWHDHDRAAAVAARRSHEPAGESHAVRGGREAHVVVAEPEGGGRCLCGDSRSIVVSCDATNAEIPATTATPRSSASTSPRASRITPRRARCGRS